MTEQNEHIFTLLQKDLASKPDNFLLKEEDVISFYKRRKSVISDRLARDILKRLYPDLNPKVRKERYFARLIISKFILHDIGGTQLSNLLEPYNLELIEKELSKRNITLSEEVLEELVKSEFSETSARWTSTDIALQVQAVQDKMSDTLAKMQKAESRDLMEGGLPVDHFQQNLSEMQRKMQSLDTIMKGFSTYSKTLGLREFTKRVNSYKAEVHIEGLKKQLAEEERIYLEHKLSQMRNTANDWEWEIRYFQGRIFVVKGGRGSSKSYGTAKFLIERALLEDNSIFLCVRQTRNVISDSSLSVLKKVIADFELERFFDITAHTLRCKLTGSYFIFKGTKNPENTLKSLENVKYVWIDEAQLIPAEFFVILNPTIRRDDSLIILTYNPKTAKDPVYTGYVHNPKPTTKVLTVNYDGNQYLPKRLKEERLWDKEHMPDDDYRHIWLGEVQKHSDALVFKGKFTVEETPDPDDQDERVIFYYGADWGDKDPTVLVRTWITKDWELVVDRVWWATGAGFDEIEAGFRSVLGSNEKGLIRADTNFPQTIGELSKRGLNISGVNKSSGSVEDGIRLMKSFKNIIVHPDCKRVVDEFNTYKYKTDPLTGEISSIIEAGNDHCMDSIRYSIRALKEETPAVLARRRAKGSSRANWDTDY